MIYAGVDIGSRAAKAALIRDDEIISSVIRDTGAESIKTSNQLLSELLDNTGMRCKKYCSAVFFKVVFKPALSFKIEVIGGLIK
jgi:activator of 2-hydroxyglutaryl-CoA dehydratase